MSPVRSTTTAVVQDVPVWFGPTERPRFGWVTSPSTTTSIGGLLVAPTIGREARAGRRALRYLADSAARRGFLVLRFDFEGTGDSSGSLDDPDRDRVWKEDVGHGLDLLRSLGATEVSALGLRLGATVVGAAAKDQDLGLHSLVLWDPCESGRNYLRELSALEALRRAQAPQVAAGAVATAEFVFSPQTSEELRRLDLTTETGTPLAPRVLVVARDDRATSSKFRARLGDDVEWRTTSEQGRLLDVDPLFASLPTHTADDIVEWLVAGTSASTAVRSPDPVATAAVVARTEHVEVVERCVRLGGNGLFGIVCDAASGPRETPLVVFLNVSNEEHTGPSRLWVELARRWAARGLSSVRFDFSGLGDSPLADDRSAMMLFERVWLDDTLNVVRELADDPSQVVLVGLCSGAYWAIEAGAVLRARGVCVINPPVGIDFLHGVTKLSTSRFAPLRALAERLKQVVLHLRWVSVVLWKVARLVMPSVFSVDVMRGLVDGGTDLVVLSCTDDLAPVPGHPFLDRFFSRRLVVPANYEVTFVPELDHSLHDANGRARAIALLDEHMLATFAPASSEEPRAARTEERL